MSIARENPSTVAADSNRTRALRHDIQHAWTAARDEAAAAYDGWCAAPWSRKRDAYAAYVAAADREEAAASLLMQSGP